MTLTRKILTFISILGFIPIFMTSLLYFNYFRPNIKKLINSNITVVTELIGDELYRVIFDSINGVKFLSTNKVISNQLSSKQEYNDVITNYLEMHNIFKDITYLDIEGNIISSGKYMFREISSTRWFKESLENNLVISDVHAVLYPYEITMTISCPVYDNDLLIGVIVGHLDLNKIYNIIEQTEDRTGYEICILDGKGIIIYSKNKKLILDKYKDKVILDNIQNQLSYSTISLNTDKKVYKSIISIKQLYKELNINWNVLALEDTDIIYGELNRLTLIFYTRGILFLLLFIFIFILLSKSLHLRLNKLKEVTKKLGKGDFSAKIMDNGNDEVSDLIKVFSNTRSLLKEGAERLIKANERFDLAVKGANDVIWDWDIMIDELYIGEKFWELIGEPLKNYSYITMDYFKNKIHIEDLSYFNDQLNQYLEGIYKSFEVEYRIIRPDDGIKWVLTKGLTVRDKYGHNIRMAGSHTDITSRKIMEQKMAFNAYYDVLTELPNRSMLIDRLKQALNRTFRNKDYSFSLLFLDFDGFKHVNDTYGHDVGDQLLIDIGSRLKDCIRPLDLVARIGGDEFVIIIEGISNIAELNPILNRIIITSKDEFLISGKSIFTSVSIGVSIETEGDSNPDELIQKSDIAMYHSKLKGKSQFTFYTDELHSEEILRWSLEHELHKALGTKELQLFYQPIIDVTNDKLYSFEALMRWYHPTKGLISPKDFIPAAEETGFISNMTKWLISEICYRIKDWESKGYNVKVSFNVTTKDFFINGGLDKFIDKILKESGCKAELLALEVTEGVMIKDFENITKQLKSLRKMGLSIKLDDFGTGYSSLSYLNKFEIDYIKIDKSFIDKITDDQLSAKIVKTIINLSSDLKLKTIAEGVESRDVKDKLKKWGCNYIQGFYYSKPLCLKDVFHYLENEKIKNP